MVPDLLRRAGPGAGRGGRFRGVGLLSVVETFAVAVVGGLTGSACGSGILMWARHRERELDLEERHHEEMAAEANTFAGAAAAAQSMLTAAKWEGVRNNDGKDFLSRMLERHDEMTMRLARIHTAFGAHSEASTAAVRVNEEVEACLRRLSGVYAALRRGEDVDEEWDLLEAEEQELSAWRAHFGEVARAELVANGNARVRI
jgi:hypothetical protein